MLMLAGVQTDLNLCYKGVLYLRRTRMYIHAELNMVNYMQMAKKIIKHNFLKINIYCVRDIFAKAIIIMGACVFLISLTFFNFPLGQRILKTIRS